MKHPFLLRSLLVVVVTGCMIYCIQSCKKSNTNIATFPYNFYNYTSSGCIYVRDTFSFVADSLNSGNPEPNADSIHTAFRSAKITSWSYIWDFGDGTRSSDQLPTHIYSQAGTYTVSLIINNDVSHTVHKSVQVISTIVSGYTFRLSAPRLWNGTYYNNYLSWNVVDTNLAINIIDSSRITFLGATLHLSNINASAGYMIFYPCYIDYEDGMNASGNLYLTYYYDKDSVDYFYAHGRLGHEDYETLQLDSP